jgi:hypothetical protein
MEPVVPMNGIVTNVMAAALAATAGRLNSVASWPSSSTGFAYWIFDQTGTPKPPFATLPLKETSASALRRTPELAAFGYVMGLADAAIEKLWSEAIEHLRGREIYPADRQSFIFNPIEILGVAVGMRHCSATSDDQREWFANTILRGLRSGLFRTPVSLLAANTALSYLDEAKAATLQANGIDTSKLATPELVLTCGIDLGFERQAKLNRKDIQFDLVSRILGETITVSEESECSTIWIVVRRAIDGLVLGAEEATPLERIVVLCRRFPLFVERLQNRQHGRLPSAVSDEYDVQDLLHAILKLHFDDVRPEEYTPSFGGNTSRVDFLLPTERIVVEAKMTRKGLGQKEVTDQLINDVARYSKMDGVDTLICLVFDPERRCKNPDSVENDVQTTGGRLTVRAIVCPKGL